MITVYIAPDALTLVDSAGAPLVADESLSRLLAEIAEHTGSLVRSDATGLVTESEQHSGDQGAALLAICRALLARGHEVRVANDPDW